MNVPLVYYKRGSDCSRLNIRPFFTAPRCYMCSLTQCPLFLFLVLRSIRGAHALIKNELAPLPLVYLKWMRAAVGAYLSPPDFHGTLWRTGRAKMQNFSSLRFHAAFATLQLLYLRCDELRRQLLYKLNKAKWARYISSRGNRWIDRDRERVPLARGALKNMWNAEQVKIDEKMLWKPFSQNGKISFSVSSKLNTLHTFPLVMPAKAKGLIKTIIITW